jgi:hypothetical protein
VDDSDFTQFVEDLHGSEDDSDVDSDFILESDHSSESEKSSSDNKNDLELAAGGYD